jgi:transcriptional regulator
MNYEIKPKTKRNQKIFDLRQKGWSLRKIAHKFRITDTRVAQILKRKEPKNE